MTKSATTSAEILPVLRERWSPWAFDADHPLSNEGLTSLLEAARWTSSSNNSQPWRFIVGRRDDETFAHIFAALNSGNQAWAGSASALIVAVGACHDQSGAILTHSDYDLGAAVTQLVVQAHAQGLFAHQIAGFKVDQLRVAFAIPEGFEPRAVIAVGALGENEQLPEKLQLRNVKPRTRLELKDLAFKERWGTSAI